MKLSTLFLVVSLALSTVVGITYAAPCLDGALNAPLDVQVVENATISQSCKDEFFSAIETLMGATAGCDVTQNNAVKKELLELLDLGNETLGRYVDSVCDDAMSRQNNQAETFYDIAARASRILDIQEYYDGGTFLNEEIGSLAVDGAFIDDVYQTVAKEKLVEFPRDLHNFQNSKSQAVVCCWVQDRHDENAQNNGDCRQPYETACIDANPADNTDVCYVDMNRSRKSSHVKNGMAVFHDRFDQANSQTEGPTHCHGMAWRKSKDSPSYRYSGNNLFYISLYDHLHQRGYVRNVPGAPMCSAVDKAAVISRADCTEMQVSETFSFLYDSVSKTFDATISNVAIQFNVCTGVNKNNDLEDYYARLSNDGDVKANAQAAFERTIVGKNQCPAAILSFMQQHGWQRFSAD